MLKGRKILLGVTGGIAAYKAAVIIRLLVKEGAEVKVIMTPKLLYMLKGMLLVNYYSFLNLGHQQCY